MKLKSSFVFIFVVLFLVGCATSNMKPLAKHLETNGGYTLCKPFRGGNGPGYIFTYTKNSKGKIVLRPVLHAETAYSFLKLKKIPGIMPDFQGKINLDIGVAATFLKGLSTDPFKVEACLLNMKNVEITIGALEIWQADEKQLKRDRLSIDAKNILRKYKKQGTLDGVYIVYEAVKAQSLTFRFYENTDLSVQISLPKIIEGLSLDPRVKVGTSKDTMIVISPDNAPTGVFIGYKDVAITEIIEAAALSPMPELRLEKTEFKKRQNMMK